MRHLMLILAAAASMLITAPASADLGDQLAKLLANDGAAGDHFGTSVGISGTVAIVGAYSGFDKDPAGAVYLFDISDPTNPVQTAKLLPHDGNADDRFGASVAISGSTAIVGAYYDDDNGQHAGAAYLFDATTGQQVAKLHAADGFAFDSFGFRVVISGAVAIVGAPFGEGTDYRTGTAYLFDLSDPANPVQIAKLLANDGDWGDDFGRSLGISGTTAIVGARDDDDNGSLSGSAYLFDISDPTNPGQTAKLLPHDGNAHDRFGTSVAISGSTAIVGAYPDDDNGDSSGSAYLFDTTTGQQIAKLLASDGAEGDLFGYSVAINEGIVVVGAPGDDDKGESNGKGADIGSAYLFDATTGQQIAKLLASDGEENDWFGRSVGISGPPGKKVAIVGAAWDDDNGSLSGSAYLFAVDEIGTPAALTSCSMTFGTTDNPPCDVANLIDDDDVDQILRSQFGFTAFERNLVEIVINGNGAEATTMASIHTHDGSDTTNVVAKVKARNFVTNSIDDIAQYSVSFPTNDTSHSTPVSSAEYVDANGDIEVRLRYVAPATFTPLGFTVGLDQVEVLVN